MKCTPSQFVSGFLMSMLLLVWLFAAAKLITGAVVRTIRQYQSKTTNGGEHGEEEK